MWCLQFTPRVALMEDAVVLEFLRRQARKAKYVTSVCTGSLVLGAAGLLKDFAAQHDSNEAFLKEIKHTVELLLAREGIPARVEARLKRPYSVFQKLKRQKITLDQVYDMLAVRILRTR